MYDIDSNYLNNGPPIFIWLQAISHVSCRSSLPLFSCFFRWSWPTANSHEILSPHVRARKILLFGRDKRPLFGNFQFVAVLHSSLAGLPPRHALGLTSLTVYFFGYCRRKKMPGLVDIDDMAVRKTRRSQNFCKRRASAPSCPFRTMSPQTVALAEAGPLWENSPSLDSSTSSLRRYMSP